MDFNEIFLDFKLYIEKLPKGCIYIADALREDKLTEAFESIADFSEGILWLSKVNEAFIQNNIVTNLDVTKIKDFLNEINNGLVKQDFILVADMFEYEIIPFFEVINLSNVQV